MKELKKIQRQLLLYEIFRFRLAHGYIQFEDIDELLPMGRKMLQRDMKDLTDAGLISVVYNRKEKAYCPSEEKPSFHPDAAKRRNAHLKKLNRLGTLMFQLDTEGEPDPYLRWDEDEIFVSVTDCYKKMYPEISDRQRSRDLSLLSSLGILDFRPDIHTHVMNELLTELPETFHVFKHTDGKLYIKDGKTPNW